MVFAYRFSIEDSRDPGCRHRLLHSNSESRDRPSHGGEEDVKKAVHGAAEENQMNVRQARKETDTSNLAQEQRRQPLRDSFKPLV